MKGFILSLVALFVNISFGAFTEQVTKRYCDANMHRAVTNSEAITRQLVPPLVATYTPPIVTNVLMNGGVATTNFVNESVSSTSNNIANWVSKLPVSSFTNDVGYATLDITNSLSSESITRTIYKPAVTSNITIYADRNVKYEAITQKMIVPTSPVFYYTSWSGETLTITNTNAIAQWNDTEPSWVTNYITGAIIYDNDDVMCADNYNYIGAYSASVLLFNERQKKWILLSSNWLHEWSFLDAKDLKEDIINSLISGDHSSYDLNDFQCSVGSAMEPEDAYFNRLEHFFVYSYCYANSHQYYLYNTDPKETESTPYYISVTNTSWKVLAQTDDIPKLDTQGVSNIVEQMSLGTTMSNAVHNYSYQYTQEAMQPYMDDIHACTNAAATSATTAGLYKDSALTSKQSAASSASTAVTSASEAQSYSLATKSYAESGLASINSRIAWFDQHVNGYVTNTFSTALYLFQNYDVKNKINDELYYYSVSNNYIVATSNSAYIATLSCPYRIYAPGTVYEIGSYSVRCSEIDKTAVSLSTAMSSSGYAIYTMTFSDGTTATSEYSTKSQVADILIETDVALIGFEPYEVYTYARVNLTTGVILGGYATSNYGTTDTRTVTATRTGTVSSSCYRGRYIKILPSSDMRAFHFLSMNNQNDVSCRFYDNNKYIKFITNSDSVRFDRTHNSVIFDKSDNINDYYFAELFRNGTTNTFFIQKADLGVRINNSNDEMIIR